MTPGQLVPICFAAVFLWSFVIQRRKLALIGVLAMVLVAYAPTPWSIEGFTVRIEVGSPAQLDGDHPDPSLRARAQPPTVDVALRLQC